MSDIFLFSLPDGVSSQALDPPQMIAPVDPKNPEVVELYRILWRAVNSVRALKVDTSRTKITIENLKPGIAYELVIKAGNANGTSQLTQPLKFITADEYIIETQRSAFDADLFGILFAITLIGVVLGIGVWYYNSKRKLANGVTSNNSSSTSNNRIN